MEVADVAVLGLKIGWRSRWRKHAGVNKVGFRVAKISTKTHFPYSSGARFSSSLRAHTLVVCLLAAAASTGCIFDPPRHSAYDLISDDPYRELVVEIDYAQGNTPDPSAISTLGTRINERLSKPDGVDFSSSAFEAPGGSYSLAELREMREREQDHKTRGSTVVLHVFYLDGQFEEDPQVIGLAYDHAAIAVFKEALRNGLPPLASASTVERAVLVHEFGHAIGLVNNGIKMVGEHEDPENPGHSRNRDSVMYYAVESLAALPFIENVPDQFDADDIADIRRAGGK